MDIPDQLEKFFSLLSLYSYRECRTVGVTASSVNLHKVVKLELSTISFDVRSL